ncbi:MAG: PqqD family protein [Thermoplasmatales archaeon]|nr:MAG: PqqD family protein [Thermoplasmatales archaeon]
MQKTDKQRPTVEEFLRFRPKRLDFEWNTNEEGLVRINVPKFKSNFGKSFCKLIKKEDTFTANLDKLGSLVWKNCDGKNTVEQILEIIKKEFSEQKNIDQRLFLFLQQMKSLNYIDL